MNHLLKKEETLVSPWVTLVSKTILRENETHVYHSIKQADYVSVLAVTKDGRIPLVKQYRPAMERFTLELPAGLLEVNEDPIVRARRELVEETGLVTSQEFKKLGVLTPDTGRLENRLWCYFVTDVEEAKIDSSEREPGVELVFYTNAQLKEAIMNGTFDHALHVAVIGLATWQGLFSFER